jgi:hypothetical protein
VSPARKHAGFGVGGTPLPLLAQAARATCRLARRAATQRWSLLTIFFKGGFLPFHWCRWLDLSKIQKLVRLKISLTNKIHEILQIISHKSKNFLFEFE